MKIQKYKFGNLTINNKTYTKDLIIFPNKIKENWQRKQGHFLQIQDLKEVFQAKPKKLIIGTGSSGMMEIHSNIHQKSAELNIKLLTAHSSRACEIYNKEKEYNKIMAIHLTC